MEILIVDDEQIALNVTVKSVTAAFPDANITKYTNPLEAKESINWTSFDLAVFDIEMPGITGIDLAKYLKKVQPHCKIMFLTAYSQYAYEAFRIHANGYLLKGSSSEEIKNEFKRLGLDCEDEENKLVVKCFGKFDCYYNNQIVKFERSKAKELFAFLIYNEGRSCSLRDIEAALFGEYEFSANRIKQIHVFFASLVKTLSSLGLKDIIVKTRNSYAVHTEMISCDYIDYVNGNLKGINKYNGELLMDYEWAVHSIGEDI